ncbi:TetR/AcrR family transcriptional regulator [Nocardia sp. JCM 34519]|uniref:TetR/AcrR family transcriptional regulator n=1 Tax=Nocardia sp. JCM 34519 TaxID=2876118 RepID=UPI001CE43317|nr:TetR/AcrR family transcriptional regulator [Nocardia sp. JCM 34519]
MPRLADHEQRRREITGAARRVIAAGGLETATFQAVAAEAGVSVRLLQYYFGTKRELLLATHRAVLDDAAGRFMRHLAALGDEPEPRAALRVIMHELLPLDEARRANSIVLANFHTAAITGPDVVAEDTVGGARLLARVLAEHLHRAGCPDADRDGELLAVAVFGLGQGMLTYLHTPDEARALLDHLLERTLASARSPRRKAAR